MITKKDAIEYLNEMLKTEMKMKKYYSDLSKKLNDKHLKKQFMEMSAEEEDHAKIVKELLDLLEQYWHG